MSQERFDVVLKVLSGPMSGGGETVLRGPVVRIGASPGPGGFKLTGYRGLDARQAVITAYDGGAAAVAPVGTNQVRMAPHPNVKWKDIDPLSRPEYLSEGCALHLGPVGRGCTLQFMRCQALGVWTQGQLASEVGGVDSLQVYAKPTTTMGGQRRPTSAGNAVPQSFQVDKRSRRIGAAAMPLWFLGCSSVIVSTVVASLLVVVLITGETVKPMEPREGGEEYYRTVTVDREKLANLSKGVKDGMSQAFYEWVMKPNIESSRNSKLREPALWDETLFDYTKMAVLKHAESMPFYRRLENVKNEYAMVVLALRDAGLPEVFAGIPYRESSYDPTQQSAVCAKGIWQFMPEMAYRMEKKHGLDFKVRNCTFRGMESLWSPTALTPPRGAATNADYMLEGQCRIPKVGGCEIDDRVDVRKSTAAAMVALKEAWDDKTIRQSGAAVQIVIASHNAGYDDSRFGVSKSTNLLPAYKKYKKASDQADYHRFIGEMLRCPTWQAKTNPNGDKYCGSALHTQTQHYVYPIFAAHMLAVCYYGKNHRSEPAFKGYADFLQVAKNGYCDDGFRVPLKKDL